MTAFDLDFSRKQFPAFVAPSLDGQAFFENAGGSYMCAQVIDRFTRYFNERKVQPYGYFAASVAAGEEMDLAHARLARYLNVKSDEVSFGPSTSQNSYVLARGLRARMKNSDAVVVTGQEHEANSGVWRRLGGDGIEVRVWEADADDGRLNLGDLPPLLSDGKVRMLALTHCSNIAGEINPVAEAAKMAHGAGAIVVVDGVSYCPHGLPDVGALGADIYLFSLYKTYGPHQGAMVIREAAKERLEPQAHYFNHDIPAKWMVPAGPDHAQVAAANGVFDYFDALDSHHGGDDEAGRPRRVEKLIHGAERENIARLNDFLVSRNDIRLIGPKDIETRAPTFAFTVAGKPSGEIAKALAGKNIMAGAGDFYAVRLLETLGIDASENNGVVRLSFVHYTSPEEITRLIRALEEIL